MKFRINLRHLRHFCPGEKNPFSRGIPGVSQLEFFGGILGSFVLEKSGKKAPKPWILSEESMEFHINLRDFGHLHRGRNGGKIPFSRRVQEVSLLEFIGGISGTFVLEKNQPKSLDFIRIINGFDINFRHFSPFFLDRNVEEKKPQILDFLSRIPEFSHEFEAPGIWVQTPHPRKKILNPNLSRALAGPSAEKTLENCLGMGIWWFWILKFSCWRFSTQKPRGWNKNQSKRSFLVKFRPWGCSWFKELLLIGNSFLEFPNDGKSSGLDPWLILKWREEHF